MANYIKLGPKAESFYDPYSELALAGKEVKLLTQKMSASTRVKSAISGGHLSIASESEFNIFTGKTPPPEEETIESEFGSTAAELIAYYEKNYEVDKKTLTKFKKKSLEDMVEELTRLE